METPEAIRVGQRFVWERDRTTLLEVEVTINDPNKRQFTVIDEQGDIHDVPYGKVLFIGSLEQAYKAERAALDWLLKNCGTTFPGPDNIPIPVTSRASLAYVMGMAKAGHREPARDSGL